MSVLRQWFCVGWKSYSRLQVLHVLPESGCFPGAPSPMTSTFGCLESQNLPNVLTFTPSCRYGTMCKCWALNPGSRPSFSELVSFMCNQLTDREEKVGCFHSSHLFHFFIHFWFLSPSASSTITRWSRRSVPTPMRRPPRLLLRWRRRTRTRRPTNILNHVRPRRAKSWRPAQRRRSCWSLMHSAAETSFPCNHRGGFHNALQC